MQFAKIWRTVYRFFTNVRGNMVLKELTSYVIC